MELSSVIGKQILSPAGEVLGYIKGAFLSKDYKKLVCFVCIDGEEEEFYLPARALLSSADAAIAGKARLKEPAGVPFPVGKAAFTDKGESLGAVADYLFGEGTPAFVAEGKGTRTPLPVNKISVGDAVILHERTFRPPHPARREEETAAAASTSAAPAGSNAAVRGDAPFDRCNLLGRRVKRSVYDGYGVLIAGEGELITREVLSSARRANRLLQLAVNTLTNLV